MNKYLYEVGFEMAGCIQPRKHGRLWEDALKFIVFFINKCIEILY